jgi:DNA sulfur modification protein DndD
VSLSFRYALEGIEHLYEVRRSWSVDDGRVREDLRISRDGLPDAWLADNWPQLVEELFPIDIAQLFFFDAEKIRSLAEDDSSSKALEAAIKSLLGLDVVERLIADSAVLQARLLRKAGPAHDQSPATALEQQILQGQARLQRLTTERAALENARLRAEQALHAAEERFAARGGALWEARQHRTQRLAELDRLSHECEAELVTLAAGDLPLALVPDLLANALDQANQEQQASEANLIHQLLQARDDRLLAVLQEARASSRLLALVTAHLGADRDSRRSADVVPRLHLSAEARSRLGDLRSQALPALVERARGVLDRLTQLRAERDELERAEAATPPDTDLADLLQPVKDATRTFTLLNEQARRLDDDVAAARLALETSQRQLRQLFEAQVRQDDASEDARRMLHLAERTRDTMQEFLRQVTARKIDRLSALITESFRFLLRKGSLVERIVIDPRNFAITLDDTTGRAIPRQRLSEGEKQIFAIAVLWGLARAAARPLPAVIDTPMARLDSTHRRHLVEGYFPHASHQVVIFSTDTEVDRESYRLLQPAIARAYHLNYDESRKRTVGEEGYFWKEEGPLTGEAS